MDKVCQLGAFSMLKRCWQLENLALILDQTCGCGEGRVEPLVVELIPLLHVKEFYACLVSNEHLIWVLDRVSLHCSLRFYVCFNLFSFRFLLRMLLLLT